MSLEDLLHPEIQNFVNAHLKSTVNNLALKKNPFPALDYKLILNQIEAKAKAEKKLPTWFHAQNILFPPKLSIEQTSSEVTAAYKSKWVSGSILVDLTGGFGVDSYFFAQKVKHVYHCEHQPALSAVVQHNFKELNCNTITCISGDGLDWLHNQKIHADWLYIDPSRRHDLKGKVFLLADCEPNVPQLLKDYWNYSQHILLKAAPILDITSAIRELECVKDVIVVAVSNEVKELLFILEKDWNGPITIHAVALNKEGIEESFQYMLGTSTEINYVDPKDYLFEPNPAVMKSGGQDLQAAAFQLEKLHPHTHLYTGSELVNFPGRRFQIIATEDYSKETLKKIKGKPFNVATRNFPETVEQIRKKGNLKDGGDDYLFFVTLKDQRKVVLFTKKI